jgi:hypothetical protein
MCCHLFLDSPEADYFPFMLDMERLLWLRSGSCFNLGKNQFGTENVSTYLLQSCIELSLLSYAGS